VNFPGRDAFEAAHAVIRPHIHHTPLLSSRMLSEATGFDAYLKAEIFQRTGSYKIRGPLNKFTHLTEEERRRGVVCSSAGNHAQGVALAARIHGIRAVVCMAENATPSKIAATRAYGAEVVLHGTIWDEANEKAKELVREQGLTYVHPFDDMQLITGQGTVGLEIMRDLPDVDVIVVPIGGGGLISGMAYALKALRPEVRLIGVQAEGAAPMALSIAAGRRVTVAQPRTIAEGIRVGFTGEHTFPVVRALVDEVVTVDDAEITEAAVQTILMSKVVPEAAGVAAVAALLAGRVADGRCVCAVVSGGNIDLHLLGRIMGCGRAHQGFYHMFVVRLADAPGELQRVVDVLRETRSNIVDIQHHRAGWKVPVGFVDVEVLVETRHPGQGEEIERRLSELGLRILSRPGG
jgi:threonine dehydratase